MRIIASCKTTSARIKLFERFINAFCDNSLHDPLTASVSKRITIATDFETTFALSLGNVLAEKFQPHSTLSNISIQYVEKVCFGCSVHEKRMILEKSGNNKQLYSWLVGTRMLETDEEVEKALSDMQK